MTIEERVKSVLEEVSLLAGPSTPDPAELRRKARRRSLAPWAITSIIVVAVGGVSLGLAAVLTGSHDSGPAQSPEVIGPISNSIAWASEQTIHVGNRTTSTPEPVTSNLGLTSEGIVYGIANGDIIYQTLSGSTVTIGRNAPFGPAANPTSGLVAWFESKKGGDSLVIFDVATQRVVTRRDLDPQRVEFYDALVGQAQAPVMWVGRSSNGSALAIFRYRAMGAVWSLEAKSPHSTLSRLSNGEAIDASDQLLAVPGRVGGEVIIEDFAGNEQAQLSGTQRSGQFSPDGEKYADFPAGDEALRVWNSTTGASRALDLDPSYIVVGPTWSSADTLMFRTPGSSAKPPTWDVRACNVDTLQCRLVAENQPMGSLVLPDY